MIWVCKSFDFIWKHFHIAECNNHTYCMSYCSHIVLLVFPHLHRSLGITFSTHHSYNTALNFVEWINRRLLLSPEISVYVFPGSPPATGTGTLVIHLEDYNDNAPYVVPSVARVCEDAHDMNVAIVGGRDKDLPPNGAPFKIELGKQPGLDKTWKITRVNCEYFIF